MKANQTKHHNSQLLPRAYWLESSTKEIDIARSLARVLRKYVDDSDASCCILESIAESLVKGVEFNVAGLDFESVRGVRQILHEINEVDLTKPFPTCSDDLTTNMFARIAYEFTSVTRNPLDNGVVATPPILAMDMVALAASTWLASRLDQSVNDMIPLLFGESKVSDIERTQLAELISQIRWYDPCVGGGVFVLAILLFLSRFGLVSTDSLPQPIYGQDIDQLALTATNIRMSLAISHITGDHYDVVKSSLPSKVVAANSLVGTNSLYGSEVRRQLAPDIVIGNPPYVRANRIAREMKLALKRIYPEVAGGTVDLYCYFIAHGLSILAPSGVLCYVSPASFQKNRSGYRTRKFISQHGGLQALFDFDELPVFNGASIHSSVYALVKSHEQGSFRAHSFITLPDRVPLLAGLTRSVAVPANNAGVSGWNFGQPDTEAVLELLNRNAITLGTYAPQILSGIKTGCIEAFFITKSQAEALSVDESSREIIKPMLRPISIRSWKTNWDGTHLLFIKKGQVVPDNTLLMQHLQQYESSLRGRTDTKGHPTWYGLRECDYYHVFAHPKILFPDIATECRFTMDLHGFYIPDGSFTIPLEDYFLLGLLNSCVGRFYFRARCSSIGNPQHKGRLRFKKAYVAGFPIPRPDDATTHLRDQIADMARRLTIEPSTPDAATRIDEMALALYCVPEEYKPLFVEIN